MADDASAQPQNIREFNQIAVVIFAQLYIAHPLAKPVGVAEVASLLGTTPTTVLPSGRSFKEVFESTVWWLHEQGYIYTRGSIGVGSMTLSDKTFYAMNVVPPALKGPGGEGLPSLPTTAGTTGTALVQATEQASQGRTKQLVDLAGTFIGSIIRSTIGSG